VAFLFLPEVDLLKKPKTTSSHGLLVKAVAVLNLAGSQDRIFRE
jgi:hypothetical protein